jgi:hypothetical protein
VFHGNIHVGGEFLKDAQNSVPPSYDWNGDDLQGRGLYLDMPWQACVFSLVKHG